MKSINFLKLKYLIPLFLIPFNCISFYIYRSYKDKAEKAKEKVKLEQNHEGLVDSLIGTSKRVENSKLTSKYDAVRDKYKQVEDETAVNSISALNNETTDFKSAYTSKEKLNLDSIRAANEKNLADARKILDNYKNRGNSQGFKSTTKNPIDAYQKAITKLTDAARGSSEQKPQPRANDPYKSSMDAFKAQMNYLDSVQHSHDPVYQRQKALEKIKNTPDTTKYQSVKKSSTIDGETFNTIATTKENDFIKATIDEGLTVLTSSRVRLRLLEDITIGNSLLKKNSYLYAQVSGFRLQRVLLQVNSALVGSEIVPIRISIYDNDGLEGLYVPASFFREFSKQLGSSEAGNIVYQSPGQDITTSLIQSLFTSSTQAAANIIKKEKAIIKYNTVVYLISKK